MQNWQQLYQTIQTITYYEFDISALLYQFPFRFYPHRRNTDSWISRPVKLNHLEVPKVASLALSFVEQRIATTDLSSMRHRV